MKIGDRVAWYRYDDHLTKKQRYGEIVDTDEESCTTLVRWDNGKTSEVFTRYLEPEAEVREYFAEMR